MNLNNKNKPNHDQHQPEPFSVDTFKYLNNIVKFIFKDIISDILLYKIEDFVSKNLYK